MTRWSHMLFCAVRAGRRHKLTSSVRFIGEGRDYGRGRSISQIQAGTIEARIVSMAACKSNGAATGK
jgi:hypothetical protein